MRVILLDIALSQCLHPARPGRNRQRTTRGRGSLRYNFYESGNGAAHACGSGGAAPARTASASLTQNQGGRIPKAGIFVGAASRERRRPTNPDRTQLSWFCCERYFSKSMATQASSRVPSAAANGKHGSSLISDAQFRRLYELTLRLRLSGPQPSGAASLGGRAAALAAVTSELRSSDALVADQPIPAAIRLTETAAPFTERVVAALARATADRLKKNARVTVIFSGSRDLPGEARSLAAAARLPVLFVEDAPAAPNGPRSRARAKFPAGPHAPISIPVDAQDVIALYRVAHESIVRAREGSGPTRILCTPWPARIAPSQDAVMHLERWLEARGLPAHQWRRDILSGAGAPRTADPSLHAGEQFLTEVL